MKPEGSEPVLEVVGLTKRFPARGRGRSVSAVEGASFRLEAGQCLALVGESGSGKSTLARCVVRLIEPDAGTIRLGGLDWLGLRGEELRRHRAAIQMVFQDPAGSLNPRLAVGAAVAEVMIVHRGLSRTQAADETAALFGRCGLDPSLVARLPSQLSGGQRQRVALARALAPQPRVLVADEPVSALDVSMQRQILELLASLSRDLGLAVLLISHDLAAVARLASHVAVVAAGHIVEQATAAEVFAAPRHPATLALLDAAPRRR